MSNGQQELFKPQGPLIINTVNEVVEQGSRVLKEHNMLVDFSETTEIDSSALAVILQWKRDAEKAHTQLGFIHVPDNLKTLAELYGVSFLFI